ncbi:hypothetical protein Poli38472_005847 [Pythium oligandrum]|uniref:N-acetyltransferase domain-containing protein n=1 Tax=Pythium oligandrum TaxID=41045 RepID=A0A8K1CRR6_PYTOL|nr:hypothetical protein Poli38472_005847 [Pythium oligandrum]|eukprot:TMW68379.1 hypothetical protein Poli38472_005847 [Pythium oligandrum]
MPLEVIRVTTSEEFEIAKRLRYEVFALQLGFDPAQDLDKYDFMDTTVHLIGRDVETNEYVAVARCLVDPAKREAKIGRVGVLTKFQCRGYGGLIIAAIHRAVQARCDTISLGAMPDKVGFYRRLGYVRINDGTFFDDNGVELCWMIKNLDDNNTES